MAKTYSHLNELVELFFWSEGYEYNAEVKRG